MAGPELILTTVNCSLEQTKPKSQDHSVQFVRSTEITQMLRDAAEKQRTFKSHDLYSDWVTRKWELGGAHTTDNCKPELKKKHVALLLGCSLRNPSNWWFPMEKVSALLTVYPWPIWETVLAKITSLLISLAGGGSDSHQLKVDWVGGSIRTTY